MALVKVKFTRDAVPYGNGDEAWFEEDVAMRIVVEFGQAVFCDTLITPPIESPGPKGTGKATGAEVSSPPSAPAAQSPSRSQPMAPVLSMQQAQAGGRRRR